MTRAGLDALGKRAITVLARMNQPSSWNAYLGLAVAFGLTDAQWQRDSLILAAVCGVIAVLRDDGTTIAPVAPAEATHG